MDVHAGNDAQIQRGTIVATKKSNRVHSKDASIGSRTGNNGLVGARLVVCFGCLGCVGCVCWGDCVGLGSLAPKRLPAAGWAAAGDGVAGCTGGGVAGSATGVLFGVGECETKGALRRGITPSGAACRLLLGTF